MTTPQPGAVVYSSQVPPHVVIRRRREDLKLSQDDIARKALDDYGISGHPGSGRPIATSIISEIENGFARRWPIPPSRALAAILLVLDLDFSNLGLRESDDPFAAAAVRELRRSFRQAA